LIRKEERYAEFCLGHAIAGKLFGRQRRRCDDNIQLNLRETCCENGKWVHYLWMLFRERGCENNEWIYYLRMLSSFGFLFQRHWEYWWTKCD
jgi:hypothetical protein